MPKENAKMQSWRFFHYARKYLGRSVLYQIFGKRHARTVDSWCEDPRFTDKDERAFDPVQGVHDMLTILDDNGHCGVVRSCISFLISGTSIECGVDLGFEEIKQTIVEEKYEDYRMLSIMHDAISSGDHPDVVEERMKEVIAEVERTNAKYRKDFYK